MAITRVKTWIANDILTATDLNAEFDAIFGPAGQNVSFPRTAAADFNTYPLQLDDDKDTTIRADTDDQIDIAIGGVDTFQFTATQLTISGNAVLTSLDQASLKQYAKHQMQMLLPRLGTVEARAAELSSKAFLMSQLNNF